MDRISPELALILNISADIYKKPFLSVPKEVKWDSICKLAFLNKIAYYTTMKIAEGQIPEIAPEMVAKAKQRKVQEDIKLSMLNETIKLVADILKNEQFCLFKTYRGYPHVTHDTDILVSDLEEARAIFLSAGLKPHMFWDKRSFEIIEDGLLEIEVYNNVSPGPMVFIDSNLPWSSERFTTMNGINIRLPSIEADIMTFIADIGHRTYEINIGDILYIYLLAPGADWQLLISQAKKYGWYDQFVYIVGILNGLHRQIYGEQSPMESELPNVITVDLKLPYILPLTKVANALWIKGTNNLLRLPGYYSIRLKNNHAKLHKIYSKFVLVQGANIMGRFLYRGAHNN